MCPPAGFTLPWAGVPLHRVLREKKSDPLAPHPVPIPIMGRGLNLLSALILIASALRRSVVSGKAVGIAKPQHSKRSQGAEHKRCVQNYRCVHYGFWAARRIVYSVAT